MLPEKRKKVAEKSNLERVSRTSDGTLKPNLQLVSDRNSYHVFYIEGLEGYHKQVSLKLSTNGVPKAVYLNYGDFLVKPGFHLALNLNTSDPQPKTRKMNGNRYRMGLFEVLDYKRNEELVLWCYTAPNDFKNWEVLKMELERMMFEFEQAGIKPMRNGYYPIVVRIGKSPIGVGLKYAVAVGAVPEQGVPETPEFLETVSDPYALEKFKTAQLTATQQAENFKKE